MRVSRTWVRRDCNECSQPARLWLFLIRTTPQMHPLELFDRFRRWFSWALPDVQIWDRNPDQVAPDRNDDWLLEPASLEEARLLFPQLDEERALLATSNSAWRCVNVTDVVFDRRSKSLLL